MAIKNLTDRVMLPRLGKIHLGVKVQTDKGTEYPRAVDYFVCPPEVQQVYGEKPTSLDIMFPIDDEEKAASQFYRAYTRSRGLVCKGDGEKATRLVDLDRLEKTGEYPLPEAASQSKENMGLREIACPGEDCPDYQRKACRAICNVQFLLPRVPGIGIWQIDTSSFNGMVRINSALRLLRSTAGRIHGIPLTLALEPLEVSPDGKKKTVHILNLKLPNITLAQFQASVSKRALPGPAETPTPDDEMPELLFPEQAGMVAAPVAPPEQPKTPPQKSPSAGVSPTQVPPQAPEATQNAKSGPVIADGGVAIEDIKSVGGLGAYLKANYGPRATRNIVELVTGKPLSALATTEDLQAAARMVDAVAQALGDVHIVHATPEQVTAAIKQVKGG